MTVTRRQALKLTGAAAACGLSGRAALGRKRREPAALGEIAAANGILFGTAYDADVLTKPDFSQLYVRQARIFTTNNFLKFGSLRREEGTADFAEADKLIGFAREHGILVRGHNLIWNDWTPDWLRNSSSEHIAYWLDRHIDEVVSRYAGRLHSWDVVNEPFWPAHGNAGGYRSGPWFSAMGKGYILRALKRARAADPSVKLVINESGPEWELVWGMSSALYRKGLLELIEEAQHDGVGIDAVGLQCHWMPDFRFDRGAFSDYLHELAARNVAIYLTEIDISDAKMQGSTAERDGEVARRYFELVSTALKVPKVEVVQTWELSDNASWLRTDEVHRGPGGRLPRPLPFDEHLRPKAAYHALARAFNSRGS